MKIKRNWNDDETTQALQDAIAGLIRYYKIDGVTVRQNDDDDGSIELTVDGRRFELELVEVRS